MKKLLCYLAVIALLLTLVPIALAAGSASLSGPSIVRAGDTVTLSFSAGGGIFGGSGSVSYDSSQLTLQSYSQSIGGNWAVEFNGNTFVFYDNSLSDPINGSATIFTATFTVNSGLAEGTDVSVTASGVTLSDGQQDTGAGSPSWSTTIAPPLSGDCKLASLTVSGASISPAFSANVTEYSASVPYSVSSLGVKATASHPNAQVSIDSPYLSAASTTSVKVTVTAENGAVKTYVIYVYREQDPNYVPSNNANLKSLSVNGFVLSPVFDPNVQQYYVWLPYETTGIDIQAETEDGLARVTLGDSPELAPGKGTAIPVTVTAEDGTEKIYTVTAVRAPAHEDAEAYIGGVREPEPTEPEPTEPVTEPPVETTAATVAAEPTQAPTVPVTEPVPPQAPAGSGRHLWVALIGAAVGAGITAGVFFLLKKKAAAAPAAPEEAPAEVSEQTPEDTE